MPNLSIAQALVEATHLLRRAGIAEARRDAATLLADLIGRDSTYLISNAEREVTTDDVTRYRVAIERRATGEPLQYIKGHQEFFNLDFTVTPDVLIPRPETELLVETALGLINKSEAMRICDVGTGSGCIAISILYERPSVRAVALDISPDALIVAAGNATRHGVRDRIDLIESDCFEGLKALDAKFHLIVSNPPYIPESTFDTLQREVRDHEPRQALISGFDGLEMIRRLLEEASDYLLPTGHLIFEIGFDQHQAARELIDQQVWTILEIHKDLQGIHRTVVLQKRSEALTGHYPRLGSGSI